MMADNRKVKINRNLLYLLCGAPSRSETSSLFCNDIFNLWVESVLDNLQYDFNRMADKADDFVVSFLLSLGV